MRHEAAIGPLIGDVEVFELLEPVDLGGQLGAVVICADNAHHEAAVEQANDRAFEFAEMLDGDKGTLAEMPPGRRRQRDRVGRNTDGAAGKGAPLAARVAVIREHIGARHADDNAAVSPAIDENNFFAFFDFSQRHGRGSESSNLLSVIVPTGR
ncbi:MAG: hypothetical protein WBL55_23190 [Xanthobacteraceae bacterium]